MSVYFIAEIGINHNGDMKICKKLIDIAKDCGCDAVKFQKRDIESVYSQEFLNSKRESQWGNTQLDQKRGLEFNLDDYIEIDKYCKDIEIDWLASAWDIKSQYFLSRFNFKFNKVASPMLVNYSLLEIIAKEKKHTFISTGMSTYDEIDKAVEIFTSNNCSFELMHCVSTYPMLDEDANLKMIETLRLKYNCNVGYSGHETGLAISLAATALGASSIERHITLDRSMYGSDQAASLEPSGLRQLLGGIRKIEVGSEKLIAKKLRNHIQACK